MKAQSKGQKSILTAKKIVFACDAGMGSSAMGATKFRNRLKAVRLISLLLIHLSIISLVIAI